MADAISDLVVMRQKTFRTLVEAIDTNQARLATDLDACFKVFVEAGEGLPDFSLVMKLMLRMLTRVNGRMLEADRTHHGELADDKGAIARKNTAYEQAYALVGGLKEAVIAAYGEEAAFRLHLQGEMPETPDAMVLLLDEIRQALSALVNQAPEPRRLGLTLDLAAWIEPVVSARTALVAGLQAVAKEGAEAKETLRDKIEAIDAFDQTYRALANLFYGLCLTAGRPDLAESFTTSPYLRRSSAAKTDETPAAPTDTPP